MHSLRRMIRSSVVFALLLLGFAAPMTAATVQDILVIRLVYPDDQKQVVSEQRANEVCQRVGDFFAENSFNQHRFNFTVTPELMMPRSWEYYNELPSIIGDNPPRIPTILSFNVYPIAQRLAREAGYDTSQYARPIIVSRNLNVPNVGSPFFVYMNDNFNANTLAHELGHSIGAPHSFAWDTELPSPIGLQDIQEDYTYGAQEVIGYGDMFDIMGTGGSIPEAHFSPGLKYGQGWLNDSTVWNITQSGRYRIYAFDERELVPGRRYAFQVKRNGLYSYWGGFRDHPELPEDRRVWLDRGIQMWTSAWDSALDTSQANFSPVQTLLDFTPNSIEEDRQDTLDGALVVGKTFSDHQAHIHVTPVAIIDDDPEAMDVVVKIGAFADNNAPVLGLESSVARTNSSQQIMLPVGGQIRFVARASDADGDDLAYHWDFGDGTNATENKREIIYSWDQIGLYNLRCTVSDMKGGVDSVNLAINVGLSEFPGLDTTGNDRREVYWGRGRILDQAGEPVQGARVWVVGDDLATQSTTDGDGRFVLANVELGDNDGVALEVYKEGYRFLGINDAEPYPASAIPFNNGDLNRIDFIAYNRQRISAELVGINPGDVTYDEEGIPTIDEDVGSVIVRIKREGPVPQGVPGDDKFIKDILDTRLLVRLFGLTGNASGVSATRYPQADIAHIRSPSFIYGSDTSTAVGSNADLGRPTTTYRRVVIQQDDNYNQPFRRNNPQDDSIEFAIGGPIFNPNPRLPNGYDPDNPSGSSPDPDQTVTYERNQLLRHLYHQNRDDVTAVVSPDDQTVVNSVVSRDWDNDGNKKGPELDRYVWFHSREEIAKLDAAAQQQLQPDYIDIVVPVIDDGLAEEDEYAGFMLGDGVDYYTLDDELVFKIADNDGGVPVSVELTAVPNNDGMWENQGAEFTGIRLERFGSTQDQLVVNLTVTDGTAVEGEDFEQVVRTAVIPAGKRFATVSVAPIDDSLIEGTEIFQIALASGDGYAVDSANSVNIAILDDDNNRVVVNKVADAWENLPGTGTIEGTFRITRFGNLTEALTVNFGFATAGDVLAPPNLAKPNTDFDASQRSVVIPPGERGVEVVITPSGDNSIEGAEEAVIVLQDGPSYNVDIPNHASMTIHDGQVATIGIQRQDNRVDEGDESVVTFTRAGTSEPMIAYYTFVGDADHGVDYRLEAPFSVGTVVFGRDETSVDVKLAVFDDQQVEDSEFIRLRLLPRSPSADPSDQVTYHLDPNAFQTEIEIEDDDDGVPTVRFLHASTTVHETALGDTTSYILDVAISRDPQEINRYDTDLPEPDANVILVDYEVVVDNRSAATAPATAGVDFETHDSTPIGIELNEDEDDLQVIAGGTLYFRRGEDTTRFASAPSMNRNGAIQVVINHDDIPEENETFLVRLKNPRNCKIQEVQVSGEVDPGTHVVTILDDDRGVFSLTFNGSSIAEESATAVQAVVQRSGDVNHPVDVVVSLQGRAIPGTDYSVLVDGEPMQYDFVDDGSEDVRFTLPFEAGEELKNLTFQAIDDEVLESTEWIIARVTQAPGAQISGSGGTITIADNDQLTLPVVTLGFPTAADQSVLEGDSATVLVTRSSGSGTLSVNVIVGQLSTAEINVDYQPITGGVTFAEGQTEATLTVNALTDSLVEGTEKIELGLLPDENYVLGEMGGTFVYILDAESDVPEVGIETDHSSFLESNDDQPFVFRLTRTGIVRTALDIDWVITGSAELGTDYELQDFDGNVYSDAAGITIPIGVDEWWLQLVPIDDASLEGEETVMIDLQPVSARYEIDAEHDAIAGDLIDDDLATVRITANEDSDAAEGNDLSFVVHRTGGALASSLGVAIQLSGDAINGSDYTVASGNVTIPANAETASYTLSTTDDALAESDESVIATIGTGAGYDIADGSAEGVIRDNDRQRVWIDMTEAGAVAEMNEVGPIDGVVPLKRSNTAGALTVRFRPGGSARAGNDYVDVRTAGESYGEITFPDGAAQVDLVLETIDDDAIEDEEKLSITLITDEADNYNVGEADLGANADTTLTLISEDVTKVTVVALSDYTKFGLANPTGFEISRTGNISAPLRVFYKMTGTATNGVEYDLLSTSVDMVEGSSSVVVPIIPLKDPTDSMTITMNIEDPTRPGTYQPGSPGQATMTLLSFLDLAVQVVALQDRAFESGVSDGGVTLQAELVGGSASLSVDVQLAGTAEAERDYVLNPNLASTPTLSLDPGIPQNIELDATPDSLIEMAETMTMSIPVSTASPREYYVIGSPAQVTILDVPHRSIEIQVVDVLGNPRPTDDYASDIAPAEGTVDVRSDRYLFEGLRSSSIHDVLFNPVVFGMRLWSIPAATEEVQ